VRDALPFLGDCLDSLTTQSLTDFEVVAVDDGSSDGSSELLAAAARRDSRLRLVSQPRRGLIAALNRGLEACRAPYVARLDADDLAARRRLELQAAALDADPSVGVVSCRVRHFPSTAVGLGFRIYERWLNGLLTHDEIMRERFIESPLPHPSVMARRRVLEAAGGYRDRGWPEDYDLWLRLAQTGVRFAKLPRCLVGWRCHPKRLTHTDRRYAVERFLACKAHHLARGPLAGRQPIVWGSGQTGRRLSKHLEREGVAPEAFLDIDPRKIGGSLRRRPVLAADELPRLLSELDRPLVVTAVSSRGARELIRDRLRGWGLEEGVEFWCAA
jgi:cellulose synthase/poly-beta-1,6-N-acetylglucosamine synthase-like glycosyltransferase